MKHPISALILTLNEAVNLRRCIESVAWSNDIVVLDSGSRDGTIAIAESNGARVVSRNFDNWAAHQNWAVRNILFKNPWVLYLDADEICTPELRAEVRQAVSAAPPDVVAFRLRRMDFWQGTWLKHATFYPTWLIRVFRPDQVRFERLVNPITIASGSVGSLREHIHHYPFSKGVAHWIERHNSYSSFEAIEYASRPPWSVQEILFGSSDKRRQSLKALFAALPCRPLIKFIYLYVFHLGFLDGRAGRDYAALQAAYEYFIGLKVQENAQKGVSEEVNIEVHR